MEKWEGVVIFQLHRGGAFLLHSFTKMYLKGTVLIIFCVGIIMNYVLCISCVCNSL